MASTTAKIGALGLTTNSPELAEETATRSDLRKASLTGNQPGIRQRQWGLDARFDSSVTFEEYLYWATVEREMEKEEQRRYKESVKSMGMFGGLKGYWTNKSALRASISGTAAHTGTPHNTVVKSADGGSGSDTELAAVGPNGVGATHDYDAEWRQAARALRTSGWVTIFYLITTDILGWGQTAYVFANSGYNSAIGCFVLFGVAAMLSGFMIWWTFLGLDSSRFPMLSFGDPFFRLFGSKSRHFINITQAFQMFCTVAVIVLGNAQIIAQLNNYKMCFIAAGIITLVIGIASCFFKALKQIGWFANAAVWINIVSFIIIFVCAPKYGPDKSLVNQVTILKTTYPVKTFWGVPPADYQMFSTDPFAAQFNGINSIVYAYSGALLFVAFLSEMRHPMDFWKGALLAQTFIMVVYLIFGAVIYTFLGQYSYNIISQVIYPVSVQVASNVLALITSFLAVFMYFNIGMKVVYLHVFQEICGLPAITTKRGYYCWLILGPCYWILAWVFSMSVPNFNGVTSLIGGLLSLNFTYSVPAIMYAAFIIQKGARLPGEGFDPYTGQTTRLDNGMKRYARGIMKTWWYSIPAIMFAMAGLASSGMGSWAAIEGLIGAFQASVTTSWSCTLGS